MLSVWTIHYILFSSWLLPAIIIACVHLILFYYINGKEADGPDRVAPQSYISMASNVLANTFGYSLRASLAIAFVQRLWLLLRVQTMKVSTIEALFSVRSNPSMLFKPAAIAATPVLCLLASIMWISQFVTSFPPGAITVTQIQKTSYATIPVPSFNASFVSSLGLHNTSSIPILHPLLELSDIELTFIDGKWFRNCCRRILTHKFGSCAKWRPRSKWISDGVSSFTLLVVIH